ncbi:MAG: transketolase C-terminal domain-containing protein [Eubacteriales bacterium]|nr:transketolase C-terminal domain-containing protein [Eubacteriales bacterium]
MNKIPNRAAICDVLMQHAKEDKDVVVLCSDSRGSASLAPFAGAFPEQFVEVGIAEQDLVGIAAGLAKCGKKAYAASPACFLSTRSYEQAKVDCAYSNTNVKLIGISGGVSYGALGMSHHSAQDIAAMSAIPNMRVYLPSDRFQTAQLIEALLQDEKPAYIRVGRNPVEDIYTEENCPFVMDQATALRVDEMFVRKHGETGDSQSEEAQLPVAGRGFLPVKIEDVAEGKETFDLVIVACGEMVRPALDAAVLLAGEGVRAIVLDMYCVKPLDVQAIVKTASQAKGVLTVEEHAPFGGLGSMVSQVVGEHCPRRVVNLSLPDAPVITGTSKEVFDYYGLNAEGIAQKAKELLA